MAVARHEVAVPATWAQGRTVYGGLSAGLLCDAVSQGVDPANPPLYKYFIGGTINLLLILYMKNDVHGCFLPILLWVYLYGGIHHLYC